MKRARSSKSPSRTTPRRARRAPNVTQIEERFALLLLLLQHNFEKLLVRARR